MLTINVTIIGFGNYGRCYMGPKYVEGNGLWKVTSVIDPYVTSEDYNNSVVIKKSPTTKCYRSIEEWCQKYFSTLTTVEKNNEVIDLCISPEVTLKNIKELYAIGVKSIIIPKPCTSNMDEYEELISLTKQYKVKALVSSQWSYSHVPKLINNELSYLRFKLDNSKIKKIIINYEKENGYKILGGNPALIELPHQITLLHAIGLVDLMELEYPEVLLSKTRMELNFQCYQISEGIQIISDMDYKPSKEEINNNSGYDCQIRKLYVFLENNLSEQPDVTVDFWIKFSSDGSYVCRFGYLEIRSKESKYIKLDLIEDQMRVMNHITHKNMLLPLAEFNESDSIVSLEDFKLVAKQLFHAGDLWSKKYYSGE